MGKFPEKKNRMSDLIEFSKERTIGQTISFAFMIYRRNSRNFWKGLALAVLPWIVAAGIFLLPVLINSGNGNSVNWDSFIGLILLSMVLYAFGFLVLNTYVNEYVIAMKNDTINQKPHFKAIVKATYKAVPMNIVNFILLTILWWLMGIVLMSVVYLFSLIMIAGFMTQSVILIGFGYIIYMLGLGAAFAYLSICTGPIIFISQYEKVHFFKALEINFSYVHARKGFWAGILISFFGFLLMYIISINITQPIGIIVGVIKYNSTGFSGGTNEIFGIIAIIYLTIAVTWPLSAFIMMMIFGANYFNQKERAVGAGLNERINKIGNQKDYDSSKLEADF
jgi:hypothetical protein